MRFPESCIRNMVICYPADSGVMEELTGDLGPEWRSGKLQRKGILRIGIPCASCKVKAWSVFPLQDEGKSGDGGSNANLC